MQLSIKGRLIVLVTLALLGLCALAALAVGSNRVNGAALNTLYQRDIETLVRLQRLENTLLEVRFRAAGVLLDQLPVPGSLNHLREARERITTLSDELRQAFTASGWEGEALEAAHTLEHGFPTVFAALDRIEQGYSSKNNAVLTQVLEEDWAAVHQAAIKPMQALIPIVQARAAEGYAQAHATSRSLLRGGIGLALLCLIGLGGVALWTCRSVLQPLGEVEATIRSIARGDLDVAVPRARSDELGRMIAALGDMQKRLRTLVDDVHRSADCIATAGREIAVGNVDLSTRTEQTSANLQQTASSMEQITQTVMRSAESARQANALAASAAEVASRGGTVVAEVVSTMDDIDASSQKIADIIGVIDGIAFQTNILALNAAVEAARAGEQGRGFAVVASEVRSLAQRSAQAAKEIKTLIGASVDKVASGARLVNDAGRTMDDIVASVQRVSDIVGEISAAAVAQSSGIGQVNVAVSELDQMTQQNAALVEESAAAAESLRGQTRQLHEVMAAFRVGASAGLRS